METVRVDALDNEIQPAAVVRKLTGPLGTTDLAINHYELEPGDSFAFAYHRHEVQEEVFYVIEGTATFETEDGDVEVGPREAIRIPPGEFQRGWNRGEDRVVALALGAPLEYGRQPKLRDCPDCGERTDNGLERREDADAPGGECVVAVCKDCGAVTGRWVEGSVPGGGPP